MISAIVGVIGAINVEILVFENALVISFSDIMFEGIRAGELERLRCFANTRMSFAQSEVDQLAACAVSLATCFSWWLRQNHQHKQTVSTVSWSREVVRCSEVHQAVDDELQSSGLVRWRDASIASLGL
jgi:hypothetical protein